MQLQENWRQKLFSTENKLTPRFQRKRDAGDFSLILIKVQNFPGTMNGLSMNRLLLKLQS